MPGQNQSVSRNLTFDLPIEAMSFYWVSGEIKVTAGGMGEKFINFTTSNYFGTEIFTGISLFYNGAIQMSLSIALIGISVLVSLYHLI